MHNRIIKARIDKVVGDDPFKRNIIEAMLTPMDIPEFIMDRKGCRCLMPKALMNAINISQGTLDYLASRKM